MPTYEVVLKNGDHLLSPTWDHVHIKLVGTEGTLHCSGPEPWLKCKVDSEKSIGKLILIELAKTDVVGPLETAGDLLLPTKVEVKSPEGETFQFPFHRSIIDDEIHQLREEKSLHSYAEGIPHCMKIDDVLPDALPDKADNTDMKLDGLADHKEN